MKMETRENPCVKCISCGVGADSVDAIASKLLPGRYNKECERLRKSFVTIHPLF